VKKGEGEANTFIRRGQDQGGRIGPLRSVYNSWEASAGGGSKESFPGWGAKLAEGGSENTGSFLSSMERAQRRGKEGYSRPRLGSIKSLRFPQA